MQGRSLWPLLRGETETHREDVYCEFYASSLTHNPPPYATMLRTRQHKLAVAHGQVPGELYDLQADPREHSNLWSHPAYQAIKTELLIRLCDRMAATVDPLPARTASW